MGSSLPVHKRVGYLSLVPHCKSNIDGITEGRMLMIRSLLTVANQPLPIIVITGPAAAQARMSLANSDTESAEDSDTDSAGSSFGKIQ